MPLVQGDCSDADDSSGVGTGAPLRAQAAPMGKGWSGRYEAPPLCQVFRAPLRTCTPGNPRSIGLGSSSESLFAREKMAAQRTSAT